MSNTNSRRVTTTGTDDETSSLKRNATTDVNNENSSPEAPVTSEKVTHQMMAVTEPLTKQLGLLCDLMKDLR